MEANKNGRAHGGTAKQGVHKAMKKSLMMAGALTVAGMAAALLAPATPAFAGDQLNITSWGGAYQMSQRKAYFEPYAKQSGTKITEEEYNGEIAKIRAMVEAKSVTWDVVDVDTQTASQRPAPRASSRRSIGPSSASTARSSSAAICMDCAVPTILYATVFAYDKDKLKPTARRRSPISSICRNSPASGRCRRIPSSISNGR